MFKANVPCNGLTIQLEAETAKELFSQVAAVKEIFNEKCCGVCGSTDIRPVCRTVPDGKKEFTYYEWQCQAEKCYAKLQLGQKQDTENLYPMRRLLPNGKPKTTKDPDSDNYIYHTHGWTKWRGEAKDE